MKLLQHSWSEILILDLVHRLAHDTWSGEVLLVSIKYTYIHVFSGLLRTHEIVQRPLTWRAFHLLFQHSAKYSLLIFY